MKNQVVALFLVLAGGFSGCAQGPSAMATAPVSAGPQLTQEQLMAVGRRVWQNECGGTVAGLTSWNQGENFASLGIGHFIWYPAGVRGPFEESFPRLLDHLVARGIRLPGWLRQGMPCPWPDRASFLSDPDDIRLQDLRALLSSTVGLQTEFLLMRLNAALPKMQAQLSSGSDRDRLTKNFQALSATPQGAYALIDYVNFKGEGTSPTERYQGQGWGLMQVLLEMKEPNAKEFGRAAGRVLTRRVELSPPERNERRWLAGWLNRCAGYGG